MDLRLYFGEGKTIIEKVHNFCFSL